MRLVSGGFYSDNVGYVAKGCKKCPNGSFVHFDKTPGTQAQDCKSCPEGKTYPPKLLMALFGRKVSHYLELFRF